MSTNKTDKVINRDVERPILWKSVVASLINGAGVALLTLITYFSIVYPVLTHNATYQTSEQTVLTKKEENNLNLPRNLAYTDYQDAIQQFYFTSHPDEIVAYYEKTFSKSYTITYLYNIHVCELPVTPTADNYKTTYFAYPLNSDGSVNKDGLAVLRDGLSSRGMDDVRDLLYSAYGDLPKLLSNIDADYASSVSFIATSEGFGRLSAGIFSGLVFFLLLPLCLKNGSSLGEKIFSLGYLNKDGFRLKTWKLPLRCLLMLLLPSVFLYNFNAYAAIIWLIGPYFADLLVLAFSSNNQQIPDWILQLIEVDVSKTEIYRDQLEKQNKLALKIPTYGDKDFIDGLSQADSFTPDDH